MKFIQRPVVAPLAMLILGAFLSRQSEAIETLEFGAELIETDDISLSQVSTLSTFETDKWRTNVSLSRTSYDIDYQPVDFDFRGTALNRKEHNTSLQINARRTLDEGLWLLAGAGIYDGFTDFRSLWLDEYFKQQFGDLPDEVPGESYEIAAPSGINATVGGRWEYKPGTGYAQLIVSRLQDDVSPGYEIDFDGLSRSQLKLATHSASLSTENVLSKRLRSLFELRASKTTDRRTRYSGQFSLNTAIGENLVWQTRVGGATENPDFDALFANSKFEYAFTERLTGYVDAGYYKDTGEIANALLFTTAAPELVNRRAGVGLRWTGEQWSFRAYVSSSNQEYTDADNAAAEFFANLYSNRDWNLYQFAASKAF